jgi:hypothetical protein
LTFLPREVRTKGPQGEWGWGESHVALTQPFPSLRPLTSGPLPLCHQQAHALAAAQDLCPSQFAAMEDEVYYLVRLEWEVEAPNEPVNIVDLGAMGFVECARLVAGKDLEGLLAQLARAIDVRVAEMVKAGAIEGDVIRYWLEVQPWNSYESWQSARQGKPRPTPLTNGHPSDSPSSGS